MQIKNKMKTYKTIKFKNKEYRIYKWENKPFNEFKIPKGFRLCKFQEFIELFDEKLINYPKISWETYFLEHYSKRKREEGYIMRAFLYWGSVLISDDSILDNSYGDGRVVVVK